MITDYSCASLQLFVDQNKIFHTGTGPLAGKEDTFPGPDNPSKMRRSVENAEHVGEFGLVFASPRSLTGIVENVSNSFARPIRSPCWSTLS